MGIQVRQVDRVGGFPIIRITVNGRVMGYAVKDADGTLFPCETLADARRLARG